MATGVTNHERAGPDAITASRVCEDVCLPLPDDDAVVTLDYPGKLVESLVLAPVRTRFCTVDRHGGVASADAILPNGVVLSDNFLALHQLLGQKSRATLIYLDPPFATGMDFHSRRLEHAYADRLGEAAYVEFMRRRLILIREVMSDDGSIYLHIGHQMLGHLKALMDEVFGRRHFRNIITRKKCSSKNFTRNQYANVHDYILYYTRSANYKWHQPGERPDDEWIEREYPKVDSRGRYKLVPIHAPGNRNGETGQPWRGMMPPRGKHWQFRPSTLEEMDKNDEIHWSRSGNPRRKVYLDSDKLLALTDYWGQFRDAHHQSVRITGYPTEKNLDMLKIIVAASSDEGDLVLDPFCGSGTTLEAANRTGRLWLGIDESFTAVRTAISRIRHGTQAMGDYVHGQKKPRRPPPPELFPSVSSVTASADKCETEDGDISLYVDADLVGRFRVELEEIAAT